MPTQTKNIAVIICSLIVAALAVGSVLFACGAVTGDVEDNHDKIEVGRAERKEIGKAVVSLQLQYKDLESLARSSGQSFQLIQGSLSTIQSDQQTMKTDMAVMKVKVNTLTKE